MTIIGWLRPHEPNGWVSPFAVVLAAIGEEFELEEMIERAWLARVLTPERRRRRFRPEILTHYPLTQPPDICARCERWTYGFFDWDLDHIVELQFGGLDHPTNLVRLCRPCHKGKPYPPDSLWGDLEAIRRFVLAWLRRGPPGGKRESWDWTE